MGSFLGLRGALGLEGKAEEDELGTDAFEELPNLSFNFGVLEGVGSDGGDDAGGWEAVWSLSLSIGRDIFAELRNCRYSHNLVKLDGLELVE